jgi:3-oxoadipate enol-lactonase
VNAIPTITLNEGDASRPALVCIPGAMCSPLVFASCARASGMRAVALGWLETDGPHDLDSIAARIVASIAGLKRVILIGHSLGTPLAVLTALREQQRGSSRIEGLVLSNSGANTKGHGDVESLIDRIRSEWGQDLWDAFVTRCFHRRPEGALLDEVRAYPSCVSKDAVIEAIRSQQATDLLPILGALACPTAVVHGEHDAARTIAHARELAGAIDGASLHLLDTGHTSCAEAPEAFAAIVREFAAKASATGAA